jgi:Lipocalin-like domain
MCHTSRLTLLSVLGTLACGSSSPHQDADVARTTDSRAQAPLIGIWRVTKFCDDDSAGVISEPLGPAPIGYFVYAPNGALSIQVMRTPSVAPFTRGDERPTGDEARQLLAAYFGYFGTYTITSDSTVVHHVQGGTAPSFVGSDQSRLFQIRGDTLTIGASRRTWSCRVLLRVRT